ncbi:hypothetical protein Ddc_20396 [Ditylenchus destructor]|nr:hypothetical protein Ddc_20396 [Ditylenchus destructor]
MNAGFFVLSLLLDQAEEFAAGGRVFVEFAQHHRGDHGRILLFDAAHHHAHAAGIHFDDARHLGQAQYAAVGQVGHVGLADEGQHVVFTERIQLDVLDQHHFAVVRAEQGTVGDFFQCLLITAAEVLHRLGGTLWRVEQALAGNVLAELAEDRRVILFQGMKLPVGFSQSARLR